MSGWWLYRNYPKTSAKATKALFIFLFISVLIGYLINTFSKNLTEDQISIIHGHLTSQQLSNHSEATTPCLLLKLQEYPKISFIYRDKYCRGFDKGNFTNTVSIGDTITLHVPKSNLDNETGNINILQLSSKETVFLSEVSRNEVLKEENYVKTVVLIIAIVFLLSYLILDITGVIDKIKSKYFTETKTELTSIRDFNEFPD
jgi:hypothetical protein